MAKSELLSEDFSVFPEVATEDFSAFPEAPSVSSQEDFSVFPEVSPEVVQQEAQRASLGAVQALDVMAAPQQFDWTDVRGDIDRQRFEEAQAAEAQALAAEERGSGTGPGSEAFNWRREADFQRGRISPDTQAGQQLAAQGQQQLQEIEETTTTAERPSTPSSLLSGFMGPGLSATAQPVVESAARNIGPAAGGALGAALYTLPAAHPLAFIASLAGGFLGSQAGAGVQEEVLKSAETPEETEERRQRTAEDIARNPMAARLGAIGASAPFFGPSLAQFGRAAAGDRGAIVNLGIAGGVGAGSELAFGKILGQEVSVEDVITGALGNMILNEPTRLGRRLGFKPSTEQAAVEAAAKYEQAPIRIGGGLELESGLRTRPTTSTADVFSSVQRQTGEPDAQQISENGTPDGGVRAPEVAQEDVPLPTPEGGEGVQPSRQGEPLVERAPEAARTLRETALKNARVDEERSARGLPPMDEVIPVADRDLWEKAKQTAGEDPYAASRLIRELVDKPRPTNSDETMLLLHERVRLSNELHKASEEVNLAREAGDEAAILETRKKLNLTEDALGDLEKASGKRGAGSEAGRAFRLRQLFAQEDFTLAPMVSRMKSSQDGIRISPEKAEQQMNEVREWSEVIGETQKQMDARVAEAEKNAAAEAAKKELSPEVRSLADRIITKLDQRANKARSRLRQRLQKMGSAPDPLIVLDVAELAATRIAKGAIEFGQWSADTVSELGEWVLPYLKAGWDKRHEVLDSMLDAEIASPKKKYSPTEEAKIRSRKTYLRNKTKDYLDRIERGDFAKREYTKLNLDKDPEYVRLKAENETAKADYTKALIKNRMAQRTWDKKFRDSVAETLAASRSVLSSADFSAVARQGVFFSLPNVILNPIRLGREMKRMFQSQFSEKKFQQNEAAIRSRDNADLYESSDLYIADIDHKPSAREEQFKSELAEKVPGLGRIVRGSSRGFTSFMNELRADAMDAFIKWSGGREKVNPETAKYLAAAINDLSGRGNVTNRQAVGAMEWLARYLFSPRLWVSRFNTALLRPIWRDAFNKNISPRARGAVLVQYVKFLSAVAALRGLASLWGGETKEDPRKGNLGELRFGSKTYDVSGGIGGMLTFLSRVATGKTSDKKGKLVNITWEDGKRPERELGKVIADHIRTKLAPIPGAVYDIRYGQHIGGKEVTPTSILKNTSIPLPVSDAMSFFGKDTPADAIKDTLLNQLGVSVRDYRDFNK